jgi:hypothetical protein
MRLRDTPRGDTYGVAPVEKGRPGEDTQDIAAADQVGPGTASQKGETISDHATAQDEVENAGDSSKGSADGCEIEQSRRTQQLPELQSEKRARKHQAPAHTDCATYDQVTPEKGHTARTAVPDDHADHSPGGIASEGENGNTTSRTIRAKKSLTFNSEANAVSDYAKGTEGDTSSSGSRQDEPEGNGKRSANMNRSDRTQGTTGGSQGAPSGQNCSNHKRQRRNNGSRRTKKEGAHKPANNLNDGDISLMSCNVRGYARNKREEAEILGKRVFSQKFGADKNIADLVNEEIRKKNRNPAMIFLQETWLQQGEKPLPVHGYTWFGKSRTVKKRGGRYSGGLGVWVHSSIQAQVKPWAGCQNYGGSEGVQWLLYSRQRVRRAFLNAYRDSLYFREHQGIDESAYW